MQLVIPMAGLGQRFVEAGYDLPKPLIRVDGLPMVVRAVQELPACERLIFIVHSEHVARHSVDAELRRWFPQCSIIVTPGLTAGQACTVRLAAGALAPDDSVIVAACDNSHLFSAERFEQLAGGGAYDCLIWTYRRDSRVLAKPEAYGWVRTRPDSVDVERVACKQPISARPLADHAISGCFWFRSAELLISGVDRLISADIRVNGEFYLDLVPNLLLSEGRPVGAFEVDKYIGWGTPQDLEDYQRWGEYFRGIAERSRRATVRTRRAA